MATLSWAVLTSASTTPGSIANWLSKASIAVPTGANGATDFIVGEAESWIYRRLRHWRMLTPPQPITLAQGSDTLAIDSFDGFLEPMSIWYLVFGNPYWLTQKMPDQVYQAWAFDGNGNRIQQPPVIFGFNSTYIQLDSQSDNNYPGWLTYYQQPDPLSQDNQTNFVTSVYPRMLRCACMAAACEWAKDNGQGNFDRTYWDALAEQEIMIAQQESDRARRGIEQSGVLIGGAAVGLPSFQGTW